MAKKQNFLQEVCALHYGVGMHCRLSETELMVSCYYDEIMYVYRKLGGLLPKAPVNVGAYDVDTPNFIIELDEENHFNRYRLSTLDSRIYAGNNNLCVTSYRNFCNGFENKCLTYGKYAKNNSTEKQFGASQVDGEFSLVSRTRWKQRAFYDFIKDITSVITGVPVVRISIYENYKGYTVEELLNSRNEKLLIEFVELRLKDVGL